MLTKIFWYLQTNHYKLSAFVLDWVWKSFLLWRKTHYTKLPIIITASFSRSFNTHFFERSCSKIGIKSRLLGLSQIPQTSGNLSFAWVHYKHLKPCAVILLCSVCFIKHLGLQAPLPFPIACWTGIMSSLLRGTALDHHPPSATGGTFTLTL